MRMYQDRTFPGGQRLAKMILTLQHDKRAGLVVLAPPRKKKNLEAIHVMIHQIREHDLPPIGEVELLICQRLEMKGQLLDPLGSDKKMNYSQRPDQSNSQGRG